MKNYLDLVKDLEKHLLINGKNFFWYNDKTDKELRAILDDLCQLIKYKEELSEQKMIALQKLYSFLGNFYQEYRKKKITENITSDEINKEIQSVIEWFKERYAYVNGNRILRRLFRKYKCELFNKHRIDVESNDITFNGPAILIVTHHYGIENELIQTISENHIFWVVDVYWNLGFTNIRWFNVPIWKRFIRSLGALELDRRFPTRHLKNIAQQSLHILETKGLVGIMPMGHTDADYKRGLIFNMGRSGFLFLVKFAETKMKMRIPIIPIGVKMTYNRYVIRIGEKLFLPNKDYDSDMIANEMIDKTEGLTR